VTADIASNWQKIDDNPGYKICTAGTRPAWGAAQTGMLISETDTGLVWRWDGTNFKRVGPAGVLRRSDGTPAVATRTTDFSTASTTFVVCLSLTNVVVPDGLRVLMIVVSFGKGENTSGAAVGGIFRSATASTGPQVGNFGIVGDSSSPSAGAQGPGASYAGWEPTGVSPGTYNYSFQLRSSATYGGTSYVRADATNVCRIVAIEL
jgi:hypothetical protein